MTICVVGGTGFLGRHLCEALHRRNMPAFSMSRSPDLSFLHQWAPSISGIRRDDPDLWHRVAGVKSVILLGSSSKPGSNWRVPNHETESEVAETGDFVRRVLEINPDCHFIYASSGGTVYGSGHSSPITEDKELAPLTSYALGKQLTENVLRYYARVYSAKVTVLRIANPVGKWQMKGRHGFVSALVRASLTSEHITVYGDGLNVRDYFDADDLAEAIVLVASSPSHSFQIYNASSGYGQTERNIINLVQDTMGKSVKCNFLPARQFDLRYSVLDPTRIANATGWKATTSLNATIQKLVSSFDAI